jgi:hypothetical protein
MSRLRIRYLPLLIAGLLVQILIFTPILGKSDIIHDVGPYIYVGTLATTLFVMFKNLQIPGMPVIILGAFLNALVITANGGYMPSPESALEDAGLLERVQADEQDKADGDYVLTNSTVADDDTHLRVLGDVLVVPERYPLSNVYSLGDIVIAIGAGIAIVLVMRRRPEDERPEEQRSVDSELVS